MIDLVYDEGEAVPTDAAPALADRWHRSWAEMRERQGLEEGEARLRRLAPPNSSRSIERFLLDPKEEDEDLHPRLQALTRLSRPSFNVVLLDEDEHMPAKLDGREVRALLEKSVSVSSRQLVPLLREMEPPAAFQRRAALRRHRVVQLDSGGAAQLGHAQIRYSGAVGLEITQQEET